jgi:hypothetical protein
MTPARFRTLAKRIAGPHWRTQIGPMIGKGRTQVWEYANGKRKIPETVVKLLQRLTRVCRGCTSGHSCCVPALPSAARGPAAADALIDPPESSFPGRNPSS